ncbi:uncharacterized protein LOC116293502 [Actinia tenebrosa]|uniref:Uncharacterized protein LOC116293502 n=1 Tax=Actinia tenebrosa TaxID=6105 RepID=A0A6P8HW27_ACTTE|nr:uncharacterized protein LOC116293502 [Actinia tenebrosa]
MDVYKQGYYWCNASNIPHHGPARSERLLLVVTDYFTSIINFKAKNNKPKNNKPQNNKPNINDQPQDPCEQIAKYLSSKDKPREYKHAKNTLNRWEESNKLSTLDCVIYGKKKNQNEGLDDYYRSLVEILKEGAKKNKIEGLKIDWKLILVKDTGMCIKETTGKQNIKGFFTWQSTKIGDSVTVECPLGPSGSSVTRRCGGDFDTGAVWIDPNDEAAVRGIRDRCQRYTGLTRGFTKTGTADLRDFPRRVLTAAVLGTANGG